jgi:hypothetical protein
MRSRLNRETTKSLFQTVTKSRRQNNFVAPRTGLSSASGETIRRKDWSRLPKYQNPTPGYEPGYGIVGFPYRLPSRSPSGSDPEKTLAEFANSVVVFRNPSILSVGFWNFQNVDNLHLKYLNNSDRRAELRHLQDAGFCAGVLHVRRGKLRYGTSPSRLPGWSTLRELPNNSTIRSLTRLARRNPSALRTVWTDNYYQMRRHHPELLWEMGHYHALTESFCSKRDREVLTRLSDLSSPPAGESSRRHKLSLCGKRGAGLVKPASVPAQPGMASHPGSAPMGHSSYVPGPALRRYAQISGRPLEDLVAEFLALHRSGALSSFR